MAKLQRPVLTRFAYWLFKLWSSTWRVKVIAADKTQALLDQDITLSFAHWHGDEIPLLTQVRHFKLATMTSTSKDGEIIDYAIKKMGGSTARGSTTRGGIGALKKLIKLSRSGRNCSLAVDGPRGPRHKVKPGIIEIAALAKTPLIPTGIYINSGFVFKNSWNKAVLPWPFTKIVIFFADPITANRDRKLMTKSCANLETQLHLAKEEASQAAQ